MRRSWLLPMSRPFGSFTASFPVSFTAVQALGIAIAIGVYCAAPGPAPAAPPEAAPAPAPSELPTQEDIHQTFDGGNYQQALQQLSRVLNLKGVAAQAYDRHDLLRLKAETQLRLKNNRGAMETLGQAAAAAPDMNTASVDLATQLLIRRSQAGRYTPQNRGGGKAPAPIAVTDLEQRKTALAGLFRDELAANGPRVKASASARSLPAFMDVMPVISSLHALEVAATDGKAEETKKLIVEPAKTAEALMTSAVEDLKAQVESIDKSANKLVMTMGTQRIAPGPRGVLPTANEHRQGLSARDQTTLRNIGSACEKIYKTSQELAVILGPDGGPLNAVKTSAEKAGRKAEQVLKADYSRAYGNGSRQ